VEQIKILENGEHADENNGRKCKMTSSRSMCLRSCGWSSVKLKNGQMPRTFTTTFRHLASLVGQHKTKNTASVKTNSRAYIVSAVVVTD